MNRKAIARNWILGLIALLLSFVAISAVMVYFFTQSKGAIAEHICRGSVAIREKAAIEWRLMGAGWNSKYYPLTCKTLDKKVPIDEAKVKKGAEKEYAMRDLSDSIARCWWMFLEGTATNIFESKFWPYSNDRCFVCYSAAVNSGFSKGELNNFLSTSPYLIKGSNNFCTLDGRGRCESGNSCSHLGKGYYIDQNGNCEKNEVCCVTDNICVDKGGKCARKGKCGATVDTSGYTEEYALWDCETSDEVCCLSKDKIITYTQYVQEYNGKGFIGIKEDYFDNSRVHAITFVSETQPVLSWLSGSWTGWDIPLSRVIVTTLNDVKDNCALKGD